MAACISSVCNGLQCIRYCINMIFKLHIPKLLGLSLVNVCISHCSGVD